MKIYNIEIITYSEEETNKILNKIGDEYNWAYATHDKDINKDTGELMKKHTHLQIYGNTQHSIKAWAKITGKKENEIQKIDNKIRAIQYLIHKNTPTKYQYEKNIIRSNFNIEEYFKDKTQEANEIMQIINFINEQKDIIKLSEILEYAINNNLWSNYRRNYSIIKDYLFEKNELTRKKLFDTIKL